MENLTKTWMFSRNRWYNLMEYSPRFMHQMTFYTVHILFLPNPFESEVFLSTKTLADMTLPKGAKRVGRSASVRSLGKWYMNRFAPAGPTDGNIGDDIIWCGVVWCDVML